MDVLTNLYLTDVALTKTTANCLINFEETANDFEVCSILFCYSFVSVTIMYRSSSKWFHFLQGIACKSSKPEQNSKVSVSYWYKSFNISTSILVLDIRVGPVSFALCSLQLSSQRIERWALKMFHLYERIALWFSLPKHLSSFCMYRKFYHWFLWKKLNSKISAHEV